MHLSVSFLALLALLPSLAQAQAASALPAPRLVTWYGPGSVLLPSSPDWQLVGINLYDKGERPSALYKNEKTGVLASFFLYHNYPDTPTAQGCRDDAIAGIVAHQASLLSEQKKGDVPDVHGGKYATASYRARLDDSHYEQDRFLFAGDAKVCAELHVSTVQHGPDEEARLNAALKLFQPELTYPPNSFDRFLFGNLVYKADPAAAAPYFKASLDDMPAGDPALLTSRRIATDQLVMALGLGGDLKGSRTVAQHAIETDPDYPLNYYNLACADAEQGNAVQARVHLEQAFARKQNVLAGEHLPDPAKDDSLRKLKVDPDFWAFVQTLH